MAEQDSLLLPCGFEYEFVSAVFDEYYCLICQLPLRVPVLTRCGHRYCKECLDEAMKRWGFLFMSRFGCELPSTSVGHLRIFYRKKVEPPLSDVTKDLRIASTLIIHGPLTNGALVRKLIINKISLIPLKGGSVMGDITTFGQNSLNLNFEHYFN